MASTVIVGIAALALWYLGSIITGYRKNIKNAKASGFKYVILPWHPYNIAWILLEQRLIPLFEKWLPEKWIRPWLPFSDRDFIWNYLRKPFDELGTEAILLVSSKQNVLFVNDASVIHQITSSRERFPKPTEDYVVMNTFGRNIVTTEGPEWRRHRKAMAPGFNEPNNRLVFHETIMQAQGMVRHWMRSGSDASSETIKSLPDDTMRISLHIITAIGFGVRLLWPGETAKESDGSGRITFTDEPEDGHTMSFQTSIRLVLAETFLIVLLPLKVLKYGTKRMRAAYESYINWKSYTEELLDKKAAQVRAGEKVEGMDIMRLLVENTSDPSILAQTTPGTLESGETEKRGTDLTKSEIFGDTFITVLAGHETTANTIHFMLVHLAMSPASQRHLQADVDSTFSSTPPSDWDYDTAITTLLGNMVGATFNEMLRLMPPVMAVPKKAPDHQDQAIEMDGETKIVHAGTRINLNNIGAQRSPKYWPSTGPSKISDKSDDLDDFVPERWLRDGGNTTTKVKGEGAQEMQDVDKEFGGFTGTDTSSLLFRPILGSYSPFSDGQRSCLGRRMAQVEMVTVMSVVFQKYSVELAVDEWASDEELAEMGDQERRRVYGMALEKARRTVRTASTILTLKLNGAYGGDKFVPVRIVKRGEERFVNLFP